MKVEVLYFDGCPNHRPALERVQSILREEGISDVVSEIEVGNQETAKDLGFPGSPTIRVNGLDIEPDSRCLAAGALACRRYPGGLPSEETIRAAVREARAQR